MGVRSLAQGFLRALHRASTHGDNPWARAVRRKVSWIEARLRFNERSKSAVLAR